MSTPASAGSRTTATDRPAGVPITRDELISIATGLFAERGYAQTTMSDIAHAAGLHQSSLYYWFRRKELILQAVFDANRAPVDFIDAIVDGPGSPALKLYRFVRYDTFRMCIAPCDPNEIERLAETQPTEFDTFWEDRNRLHEIVTALVASAVEAGEFVAVDPELAALAIVSFDEGIQKRIRHQAAHAPGRRHRFTHRSFDPVEYAELTAATVVRGFLRRGSSLGAIARAAATSDDLNGLNGP
jgi:AcrR family transcriptional regulator